MYQSELDKHIKNKTTSNAFVLFGESHFLIDEYISILSPKDEELSCLKLYYDEYGYEAAKAHLSQASLFGDKNLLIVKSDKKIPKKELDTLISLSAKDGNNFFIFAYLGEDSSAYSKVSSPCMGVRFFHPNKSQSVAILAKKAAEFGIKIDSYAISHLLELNNLDISLSISELQKLKIFDELITQKHIDMLTYGLGEVSTNDLLKKIIAKKEYIGELKNLLEHSINEIEIIGSILKYFTQLSLFNIYIREHGNYDAQKILGYKPPAFITDELALNATRIKIAQYQNILKILIKSDLELKQSRVDKEAILLCAIDDVLRVL